jgi:hypothetical protein
VKILYLAEVQNTGNVKSDKDVENRNIQSLLMGTENIITLEDSLTTSCKAKHAI